MKLELPSRRVVDLDAAGEPRPAKAKAGAPLFDALRDLLGRDVKLRDERGAALAIGSLALADFHALRAILTRLGWLDEEAVEIACRNCGEAMTARPCAALSLGPFQDRELGDPELDATLPFGEAHTVKGLGDVVLGPLSADDAAPLHAALARPSLRITPAVARAMGVVRIGDATDPARVARRLQRASDRAFEAVGDLFLQAHYPPRLFSVHLCAACGARNDVDAPYDREFEPSAAFAADREESENTGASNAESFPSFDEFDRIAHALAKPLLADSPNEDVVLVVEGGVPACDDGGEPLLGSYVPGYAGDMATPSRAPEVTVFYRTFRAIWDEEGSYDWREELEETLEHELEHHRAGLLGDDPMDEEERAEIAREHVRVLGKKAALRGEIRGLSGDVLGFLRRTWPIWLLLLVATLAVAYADVR